MMNSLQSLMPPSDAADEASYLVFASGAGLYAAPSVAVREILTLPPVTPLHEMPPLFLGVAHLRDSFVPVVDLARCLGAPPSLSASDELPGEAVLIVLEWQGIVAGLVAREVRDVTPISRGEVRFVPPTEVGGSQISCLAGVSRFDGQNLQLLYLPRLFEILAPFCRAMAPPTLPIAADATEEAPLVAVVRLSDELFGIGLDWVREFAPLRGFTPVPGCPASVMGLMNLRGEVLTLLDIRGALHLPATDAESSENSVENSGATARQITVVECDGWRVGFLVDEVLDIFGLAAPEIAPVATGENLNGTAWFENRMLSLLDVPRLLQQERFKMGEGT